MRYTSEEEFKIVLFEIYLVRFSFSVKAKEIDLKMSLRQLNQSKTRI